MRDQPECLSRRRKLLDSLIQEMGRTMATSPGDRCSGCCTSSEDGTRTNAPENDVGIELMCDFWKTLEDNPESNLRDITYRPTNKMRDIPECLSRRHKLLDSLIQDMGKMMATSPGDRCSGCCTSSEDGTRTNAPESDVGIELVCDFWKTVKDDPESNSRAVSFEQNCSDKVGELAEVQQDLIKAIDDLEQKVQKGTGLLKEADCMWSCMEGEYKRKLSAAKERVELIECQLNEVETSLDKWRKIHKELEDELKCVKKCTQDNKMKVIQKENDVKVMRVEIEGYERRIDSNKKEMTAAQNLYSSKKAASDDRLSRIAKEMDRVQRQYNDECQCYADKEKEGRASVKDVREDLQKLCKCLLQKRMENEDLKAETDALLNEVDLLQKTCKSCKERCMKREKDTLDETRRIDREIARFKVRCQNCHKETSSADMKEFCFECPRCLRNDRECLNEGDHCSVDHSQDCVCTRIKHTFLNNVFENMYTVLERQVQTCSGKELADCILNCLKKSKNGKLNAETRSILQDFILSTVRQNLNLTIVGGAVKTRCEMDQETYDQLMLCLKDVSVTSPEKKEKGTASRKLPCTRWSRTGECHCPKGPKSCPCTKTAPKKSTPMCEPVGEEVELEDRSEKICPIKEPVACVVDCGMLGLPGSESWKRAPCGGAMCSFSSNMRAAQCVLGPEALADVRAKTAEARDKADRQMPSERVRKRRSKKRAVSIDESPTTEDDEELTTEPVTEDERPLTKDERQLTEDGRPLTEDKQHTEEKKLPTPSIYFNQGRWDNFQTIKANQLDLSLLDAAPAKANLKPVSSLQNAILFGDQRQERIFDEIAKNKPKLNKTKEQLKIVLENEKGQSNREFSETPSGKLAIKLDKRTIKIMEEKSITDPYLKVSVKQTRSGHISFEFDTNKELENDNGLRVTVSKTLSGIRLLEINKNMIRELKDTFSNKVTSVSLSKNNGFPKSPEKPTKVDSGYDNNEKNNKYLQPQELQILDCHIKNNKKGGTMYTRLKTTATGSNLTEIHMPLKYTKKKDLCAKCTCNRVKDTNLTFKDIKGNTIMCKMLLNKKRKERPACSSDKSNKSSCGSCMPSPSTSVVNSNSRAELKQIYTHGNVNVTVKLQIENGEIQKLPAVVTKTESGAIAIYARNMSFLKEVSFNGQECPVLLSKTVSGTYFVSCNDESFNATLRKTSSEGILLIPQAFEELCQNEHEDKDSFEVHFCVMKNQLLELPAVLRPTTSNNYIVVLDKEFEKCYRQSVKEYFGEKFEGSVDLQMTGSGNYILELYNKDESHTDDKKRNAWLVKTSSGNIKVIVRPEFQFIFQQELSLSSTSSAQLNNNIPTTSKDFHRDSNKRSKNLDKPPSIGKLKVKLLDSLLLPYSQPSAILEKKSSSHPDLNEAKKIVIDSDSLMCNSEKSIFIKRLDSEEIIIKLNGKDDAKTHYGTLKLTPSGNFYVAVDDEVIKDLTESYAKNDTMSSSVGMRSKHATQLIDSVHKSFATTCQSANVCDPSACGCIGTTFDSNDGSIQYFCPCLGEQASATIDNLIRNDSFPIPGTSWDEKILLDVDPSFESSNSQRGSHQNVFKSSDQCYYLHHQLCNDEFCCEHIIRPKETIEFVANRQQPCQVWDSLNYLPQQLPHFLREV